jgi:formamidopyrimidine-DNA glycosylase
VGKTLAVVRAEEDNNVFGKVGTSATEVESSLTGKKVLSVGQQGKYFWYGNHLISTRFASFQIRFL